MRETESIHLSLVDVESYGDFFKNNYHAACLVALRYVKDTQEAEDLVQEVFLHIWEKRDQINVKSNLRNYLYVSVRNASINYVQRNKETFTTIENADLSSSFVDSDEEFAKEEFASKIARAIEKLPPQCKKIFLLAYLNSLSYQQIADTLQLSKNTVKTQMGIAYKLLREDLKESIVNLLFLLFRRSGV